MTITSYHAKEVAVFVRAELKEAFPGQKFSVRSERHSVCVKWTDGPSTEEVRVITRQFSGMHFDGMQDMDEYNKTVYKGEKVQFYCYSPSLSRCYSFSSLEESYNAVAKEWMNWFSNGQVYATTEDLVNVKIEIEEDGTASLWRDHYAKVDGFPSFRSAVLEHASKISRYTSTKKVAKRVGEVAKAENIETIEISENKERGGIEVRFPSKPSEETLESLKSNGFRWSRFNKCWYAKNTVETMAFAKSLASEVVQQKSEVLALHPVIEALEDESEDYQPIAPLSIESCEIWGIATFPRLNKNNTLALNNEEIERHAYEEDCKITEIVTLSDKDYFQFCDSLLDDQDWLKSKGTTESHNENLVPPVEFFHELCDAHQKLWREGAYDVAIAVTNQSNTQVVIVNPQGHDYARYVGNPNAALTSEIFSFLYQPPCAFIPCSISAIEQPLEGPSGYVVIAELPAIKPISFTTKTPQQELRERLAALNVDNMSAQQIYDLLQVLS